MRSSGLGFVHCTLFAATLAACGSTNNAGDDDPTPDASTTPDGGTLTPPARGFQVISKEIDIPPGQEITYCYYFRTPNTEPMAINKWQSVMTPGSHHMIMFTTTSDLMAPGTVSAANCGIGAGTSVNIPVWTYAAQNEAAELVLPGDDGAGQPLAQLIPPNTPAFFQMHYLNPSDQTIRVKVTLNAEALPAATAYTQTAAYITYNNAISIPANTNDHVESKTCNTPAGAKFWTMSTHAHKQAARTVVKNGLAASTTIAFESDDWEHPGGAAWMASPFYTFTGDKLTYECTYNNPTNRTITSGDSAATDEMCMATGYFFPATAPVTCLCVVQGCGIF